MKMKASAIPIRYKPHTFLGKVTVNDRTSIAITMLKPIIPIIGFGITNNDDCHEFIGPWQLNKGFQLQEGT
jgi:hypothetical protein